MHINEKLHFLQELISCNYPIFLWNYTSELELLETNCPAELITNDVLLIHNFSDSLHEYMKRGIKHPFILDAPLDLLWIVSFEYQADEITAIHMLGPAFTGANSHLLIKKELDMHTNLTVKLRAKIFRQMEKIPIIPTTILYQYASMLHYAITGQQISTINIQEKHISQNNDEIKLISSEHRGVWIQEQELLKMICEGNPDYISAIKQSSLLSSGVRFNAGDTVRQHKTNAIVLLTLCSRAAIKGSLNPSIAYTLNDYYAQRIEDSDSFSDISAICFELLKDYVERVAQMKSQSSTSKEIQNICHYISTHITAELSIQSIANQAGYTKYYFSHKFRKEIGISVNEYILREKLEHAKLLLSASKQSIQDISEELSFGSRSYFSTSFRKYSGLSPTEYRTQHFKQ